MTPFLVKQIRTQWCKFDVSHISDVNIKILDADSSSTQSKNLKYVIACCLLAPPAYSLLSIVFLGRVQGHSGYLKSHTPLHLSTCDE